MTPARSGAPRPDRTPDALDDSLSYEAARDELVDVVRRLEAGGVTLEESLSLWERGEQLAAVCRRWLDGARARLQAAAPADPVDDEPDEDETEEPGADEG